MKVVREHYARWVPERQARLANILKEAFSNKPKLAAIQGGRRQDTVPAQLASCRAVTQGDYRTTGVTPRAGLA